MSLRTVLFAALLWLTTSFAFLANALEPKILPDYCVSRLISELASVHPPTSLTVQMASEFAAKHNLPSKVVEFGPNERRVKRLVVGLDFHDWKSVEDYIRTFNLHGAPKDGLGGVLPMEFAFEMDKGYVGAAVRTDGDMMGTIWKYGYRQNNLPWQAWWDEAVRYPQAVQADLPVAAWAHVIGATPEEQKNIWLFLDHPELRGPCKSNNCVAWSTQIEFGKTAPGASEAERKYLATKLGFSRTIEHSELSRRIAHYANQEHGVMFAFLNGQKGRKAFDKDLEKLLPPLPKIAPKQAVRDVVWARNEALDKAIAALPDHPDRPTRVYFPIAAGASPEAMEALGEFAPKMKSGVEVHLCSNGISERVFRQSIKAAPDKFKVKALFLGAGMRGLYRDGLVEYIPGYLGSTAIRARQGMEGYKYDAMVVRVAPPTPDGKFSLGPNADNILTLKKLNPNIKIIAEVNPNVPVTSGDNFLTRADIAATFESQAPLPNGTRLPVSTVEQSLGENLASLLEDGSTFQIGTGNVFGGLPEALKKFNRKNIKVSTEMMSDEVMLGMINGNIEAAETGFAIGSQDLYRWLHKNPKVKFKSTEYLNDPERIVAESKKYKDNERFVAVNTAIQVDLRGQVNATMGPPDKGRISSPGGQVEFMDGASRAKNGRAVIAVRSTADQGRISTISMDLYPGPITTPHEMVTHVVTEYGIADLAGKTERERAIALINVAHPKFRGELFERAKSQGVVPLLRNEDHAFIKWDTPEIVAKEVPQPQMGPFPEITHDVAPVAPKTPVVAPQPPEPVALAPATTDAAAAYRQVRGVRVEGLKLHVSDSAMKRMQSRLRAQVSKLELQQQKRTTAAGKAKLLAAASEPDVPAFARTTPNGELPVVMVNEKTYPKLEQEMENSIGIGVELDPNGRNDHGRIRVGKRILDFGTPGGRYEFGDPHGTGVFGRPMKKWLNDRAEAFKQNGGWNAGKPFRLVETVYPLSKADKDAAELYYRSRQSGLWRAEFFWDPPGAQTGKPNLLCHPGGGAEHCYSFTTGTQTQFHRWAIRDQLYNSVGIKEDIDLWFKRPEVREFQEKAREHILSQAWDDNSPETWKAVSRDSLVQPKFLDILKDVVPGNLSPEQQSMLVNYTLADRAIEDWAKLTAKLDIKEHRITDWDNPNAGATFIYDGEHAADAFRDANYDYRGATYSFRNDGLNKPIPKAP